MAEQTQSPGAAVRPLPDVLKEVESIVNTIRSAENNADQRVIDLRWRFDQISAKMNQAIYNGETDKIHETCLGTVAVLIEILARS